MAVRYRHGLIIGKFYPPHNGHHAAIRHAASQCDHLTVLVMSAAVETIPGADRVTWLRLEHAEDPRVRIAGIACDAPLDVTDGRVWTAHMAIIAAALREAGGPVDVDAVFSGERYGAEMARRLNATDARIARTDLSSSAIRCNLAERWTDLAPVTRAGLTTRVVVVGAESTGTTTLARTLADHYIARGGSWATTQCVEEYGREYTQLKWDAHRDVELADLIWTASDFDTIAVEQTRREQAAATASSPVLICDTDAFATSVWERRYLGARSRSGQPWTTVPPRAIYLVTDHHGVAWHDDGLREGDLGVRAAMTNWFISALTKAGHSWVLLTGSPVDRLDIAVRTIDPLVAHRAHFGKPLQGPGFEHPA